MVTASHRDTTQHVKQVSRTSKHRSIHDLQLGLRGIKYVRCQWVDLSNTIRFQAVPTPEFLRLCEDEQPNLHITARTLGYVNVDFAKGFDDTSECLYVFDLESFRPCTYAPGHAVVMGWFQRQTPSPAGSLAVEICPRTLLQKITRWAFNPEIASRP